MAGQELNGGRAIAGWRPLVRRILPARIRRPLRDYLRELPRRAHDFPADLRELVFRPPARLPPWWLRRRVGLTSSRREFLAVGERSAAEILRAYAGVEAGEKEPGKWLDFGCGAGRILVQLKKSGIIDLWGVDVDRDAIRWLQRSHGRERFARSPQRPPLLFAADTFDVVLAISVFSHLDESDQLAWLAEISRVLRPAGLLIASTHGRDLLVTRRDLSQEQLARLAGSGFLFASGSGPFNENSAFHTIEYLDQTWGPWFRRRASLPRGLGGYQDLSVWQKREADV